MSKLKITKDTQLSITSWIEYIEANLNYSKHTINAYISDIYYFFEFIFMHRGTPISLEVLSNLRIYDFRSWLAYRKKNNVSSASTNRHISSLKNYYKFLNSNLGIKNYDITQLKPAKLNKPLPKALNQDSAIEMLQNISKLSKKPWIGQRNKAIIYLLYGTGIRISEALSIKLSDIADNFEKISIKGKGDKERTIYLLPVVIEELKKYIKMCPYKLEDMPYLFAGNRTKKLNPDVFRKTMRDLKIKLNLPDFTSPHSLRHSFATHLLSNSEEDLRSIQELLGHKNLSTTQRYTKINLKTLKDAFTKYHPRNKNKF